MYWIYFLVGLVLWTAQVETKLMHNKQKLPTVKSTPGSNFSDKLNKLSTILAPLYRRWLDLPILRRQSDQKKKKKERNTDVFNLGPERNQHYDPHFGYEPYWATGNWAIKTYHNESLCDEKCMVLHDRFGKICGRNKRLDTKTFDTFCAMRQYDCGDYDSWVPVYRGECRPELKYLTSQLSSTITPIPLESMAPIHIDEFIKRYPHLHLKEEKKKKP